MKKNKIIALAATILLSSPVMAMANDSFNGPFIGGQIGLQSNQASITAPGNVQLTDTSKRFNFRGFAGYDWKMADQFVAGVEIGVSRGGSNTTTTQGTANFTLDQGMMLDASARAGFLAADNFLIYGRAGYASSNQSLTANNSAATPANFTSKKHSGGILLGLGTEFAVSETIGLRVEYRRAKMGNLRTNQVFAGALFRF